MTNINNPTEKQYLSFEEAFKFFNQRLFNNELPPVMVTMSKQKKSKGYCSYEKFIQRNGEEKLNEISLNFDIFHMRTDKEIFSTFVHELVHHWQFHFGDISRSGYHNLEWANKMQAIGLMPSDTGKIGGKVTGQNMTHYILEGHGFDIACNELASLNITIDWNANPEIKKPSKPKNCYECASCGTKVWGKKDLNIKCGDCNETMEDVS